jgi:hypothetical protein
MQQERWHFLPHLCPYEVGLRKRSDYIELMRTSLMQPAASGESGRHNAPLGTLRKD